VQRQTAPGQADRSINQPGWQSLPKSSKDVQKIVKSPILQRKSIVE
jgi:hypothetical protein